MSDDIRWPSELRGGHKLVAWLNRLLHACKKSSIRQIVMVGGVAKIQNGVAIITAPQGGGSGFPWQKPKELDPANAVAKDTFVYVSPQNTLATVGLTDLVLNTIVQATPGIWQAIQDVPAETSLGYYNVPQDPVPGSGTTVPSGDPLSGDLDSNTVFWVLWKSTC